MQAAVNNTLKAAVFIGKRAAQLRVKNLKQPAAQFVRLLLVLCIDMPQYVNVPRLYPLPYIGISMLPHTVCAVYCICHACYAVYVLAYVAMVHTAYAKLYAFAPLIGINQLFIHHANTVLAACLNCRCASFCCFA